MHRHTKFEMSTITRNEDMKDNANVCKNSRFVPPFGRLRSNVRRIHGSHMARWKARVRLRISANIGHFSPAVTVEALCVHVYWSKSLCSKGVGHLRVQISGGMGRRPLTTVGVRTILT